jgi:hypothetical protein
MHPHPLPPAWWLVKRILVLLIEIVRQLPDLPAWPGPG